MKRTLASIEAEIQKLTATAEKIRNEEVAGVVSRIRVAIDHYGLTAEDLGFGANGAARKAKAPSGSKATLPLAGVGVAKFRDPASGKTWTGRGKPPGWIAGAADRNAFLIDGKASGETPAVAKRGAAPKAAKAPKPEKAAKAAKATKASKGGTPKYQDPASGKTWTGMGPAPAWLAGASNRDAFLIVANKTDAAPEKAEAAPVAAMADAPTASTRTSRKSSSKPAAKRISNKPAAKRKVAASKVAASKATSAREAAPAQSAT